MFVQDKLTCHKGHKLNLARFFPTKSLALLSTALEVTPTHTPCRVFGVVSRETHSTK